jgi:hypothetical protein
MKNQTAVEQFLNAIKDQIPLSKEHLEMIESYAKQAKEMEKDQIMDSFDTGRRKGDWIFDGEKYYEETYKKENK